MYLNVFSPRVRNWILLWWQWDTVSLTPLKGLWEALCLRPLASLYGWHRASGCLLSLCGRHCPYCHQSSSLSLKCWGSHQFPEATAMGGAVLSPVSTVCRVPCLASCIKILVRFEMYLSCSWVQDLIREVSGNSQKLWNVTIWESFTAHLWPSQSGLSCVQQQ